MMKFKEKRGLSFAAILLVYILAGIVGVLTYRAVDRPIWAKLLAADTAATVVTFLFSVIFRNASVYDPYWSVQPIFIVTAFSLQGSLSGLSILLIIAIWIWGLRLTANWAYTFRGLAYQDWRYTMLREKTGALYPIVNLFGIHLVPTLIVYLDVLPAVYAILYDYTANAGSVLFVCVSLCAVLMEGAADRQMHCFRQQNTGGIIRTGLWRYSRHPNYLGEMLMWWGVALAVVCAAPGEGWLCAGAAVTSFMFLFISIPMAERRQSRKAGYEEYASHTGMLLPRLGGRGKKTRL